MKKPHKMQSPRRKLNDKEKKRKEPERAAKEAEKNRLAAEAKLDKQKRHE